MSERTMEMVQMVVSELLTKRLQTRTRATPHLQAVDQDKYRSPAGVLVLQLQFAISAGQRHLLESIRLLWRQVPEVRSLHRDGDGSGSVVRLPGGGAATRTSSARDLLSAGVSVGDGELPGAAGLLPR
ncbi:hypothetical protein GCM10027072_73100 [Streptomyces bullii]